MVEGGGLSSWASRLGVSVDVLGHSVIGLVFSAGRLLTYLDPIVRMELEGLSVELQFCGLESFWPKAKCPRGKANSTDRKWIHLVPKPCP